MHRIGRTARAGNAGMAISLCSADEVPFLRSIEQLIRYRIPATSDGRAEEAPAKVPHVARNGTKQRSRGARRNARAQYRSGNLGGGASSGKSTRTASA